MKHHRAPSRPPIIRAFLGDDELVADSFAGGGGTSLGIEQALGRSPDLAVNHNAEAIAMHRANHPTTEHRTESVWAVDPIEACRGRRVALAWFSPDCRHHSKAKGGKPRDQKIRGLAWVAVTWAQRVRPRVIVIENVEEFRDWGPLHRTHSHGCTGEIRERRVAGRSRETQGCRAACRFGRPIKERQGETFAAFVRKLERLGGTVEHRLLRACDFGAPTTRRRMFLIARFDGQPIAWPAPTHAPVASATRRPYRTAADCIDWSIPCPSIFERAKPLAEKTLARVAHGVRKYVLETGSPFIVTLRGTQPGHVASSAGGIDQPLRTVSAGGLHHALAVAYLVHRSNGERPGQAPRTYDAEKPLGTIVAQGQKHAVCCAFLAKHYGDRSATGGGWNGGQALDRAIGTVTVRDHHALVAAFLVRYNGTGDAEAVGQPIGTLTSKPRFGLVTVTIAGEEFVVVDIGMRMLTPRELFRAQGFTDDYAITPIFAGKPLTKTAQIRMCGNSVSPPVACAIVRANLAEAA